LNRGFIFRGERRRRLGGSGHGEQQEANQRSKSTRH
jgi:hypothetical protein